MRHLVLFLVLCACAKGGSSPSTEAAQLPNPSQASFQYSGTYNREVASGTDPCPECIKTCSQDGLGDWTCAYTSATVPAACTMTLIGTIDMSVDGLSAQPFGFTVLGNTFHGTPGINWTAVGMTPTTFSGNTVTFTDFNFSIDIFELNANESVIQFGSGCAIAFTKS